MGKPARKASAEPISPEVLLRLVERVLLADPARTGGAEGVVALALDLALEATRAERGFVLILDPEGLECFAGRNLGSDLRAPELEVSRSVLELVRKSGRPFLVEDAAASSGLLASSARELGLRSVLCAPLRSLEEGAAPFGAIYLDHRTRAGAFGPAERELLVAFAERIARHLRTCVDLDRRERRLAAREGSLRRAFLAEKERWSLERAVSRSPAMQRMLVAAARARDCELPVLVQGPIGSGKEQLVRGIHWGGPRAAGPFVALDARTIPEGLEEAELFGWEPGAFTGATGSQPGAFEQAGGGTLFLDEVGELSSGLQAKLLRVLEARTARRLGGEREVPLDVRLIAATSKDLTALVREGAFRPDLYHRLAVLKVDLPGLRERLEDIPDLCERLIAELSRSLALPARPLSPAALERVLAAAWPGNVRELRNALARALVLARGPSILPEELAIEEHAPPGEEPEPDDFRAAEERWKRAFLSRLLRATGGNVSEAARRAGIARRSFHRLLTRMGIAATDPSLDG